MAGQLGYCGLDRQRQPLKGDEIRPCWEAADATGTTVAALPGVGPVWPLEADADRTTVRPLRFVEVSPTQVRDSGAKRPGTNVTDDDAPVPTDDALFVTTATSAEPRWSLWGEAEA